MRINAIFVGLTLVLSNDLLGQDIISLTDSTTRLYPVNVSIDISRHEGKDALKVLGTAPSSENPSRQRVETLVIINESRFTNGTIELEVAGRPKQSAEASARGFIGLAFHLEGTSEYSYDCFYLRPTNGRAEDQLRRNRSCQYISHPDFTFQRFRDESPGVYESYVDLVPGKWTRIRITVDGVKAQLFVNDAEQPSLIVNDLKRAGKSGLVALWLEQSTEAYFRNLKIVSRD